MGIPYEHDDIVDIRDLEEVDLNNLNISGTLDVTGETILTGGAKVNTIKHTGGTTAMTINSSGLVLPKIPILQVSATDTDQAIVASTQTKVEWETVEIDTLNSWDSLNHRYTPTVAGYYLMGGVIRIDNTSYETIQLNIYRNAPFDENLRSQLGHNRDTLDKGSYPLPTGLMFMNGTDDFVEVYIQLDEAATIHSVENPKSYFFAKLVHAT